MTKTIAIASDHGGFEMKEYIRNQLEREGYKVLDFGTHSPESVDYPDFIHPLAKAIHEGRFVQGVILCGSGNGAQITANKYAGVRAGLAWDIEQAILTRKHNNANVLALPGRFVEKEEAWKITKAFLHTDFEGGRHEKRVSKIAKTTACNDQ